VHAVNEQDVKAPCHLLWYERTFDQQLKKILTDQAYQAGPPGGRFAECISNLGLVFEKGRLSSSFQASYLLRLSTI